MKKIFISFMSVLAMAVPALAQVTPSYQPNFAYTDRWILQIVSLSKQAVTFLMVVATLYFIWTVISYIRVKEAKDAEEKKKAMIRGIIGLFVIVAIWGIIRIIASTLGVTGGSIDPQATPCPPGMQYDVAQRSCI